MTRIVLFDGPMQGQVHEVKETVFQNGIFLVPEREPAAHLFDDPAITRVARYVRRRSRSNMTIVHRWVFSGWEM